MREEENEDDIIESIFEETEKSVQLKLNYDGILSINEIKTFLKPKFEKIINENSNILSNVLRTRNKFIHEPHMIKWGYIVGGKTSCSICFIYKEEFIELNTINISNVVNELNQIMFELQNKAFESVKNLDEETRSHPYLKNVMSFDFLKYTRECTRFF